MTSENELLDIVSVREFKSQDVNFILDSFITCLSRYTESIVAGMPSPYIREHLEQQILYILNKSDTSVLVLSHKDNSEDILAYIIACPSQQHIYFSYTKYIYRELGLQKNLLMPLVVDMENVYTFQYPTKWALRWTRKGYCSVNSYLVDRLIKDSFEVQHES